MRSNTVSLFLYYSKMTIKSWFQYKGYALLRSLAYFPRNAPGIIVIYLAVLKFGNINGWNISEIAFLSGILFVTYGIVTLLFAGVRIFEWNIQQGSFDRFILRPRGLLFQIIACNVDWIAAAGLVFFGITLFVLYAGRVGIVWDVKIVTYYISAIIGGVLTLGAISLIFASLNFYYIKFDNMKETSNWNIMRISGPPNSVPNNVIHWFMAYIIPFTLVSCFPPQILLIKEGVTNYPSFYIYIFLLFGVISYLLSYAFWRYSIKFYKSTGN